MFFLVLGFVFSFPFGWGTITKFVSAFVLTAFGSLGLQSIAGFVINSILIPRHVRSRRAA